jgi:DNA-binding NarL/FixJ family response regulator
MVPEWQLECYERLRIAIMSAAVQDYKAAMKKSAREGRKCEKEIALERFFLSGWGQALSGDNGKLIIEKCRADKRYVPSPRRHSKVTIEMELDVYEDYKKGMTGKALAKKYGVCEETVRRCIKKWT